MKPIEAEYDINQPNLNISRKKWLIYCWGIRENEL
jgi:hypothetical protein